jgi:hypothetical protein
LQLVQCEQDRADLIRAVDSVMTAWERYHARTEDLEVKAEFWADKARTEAKRKKFWRTVAVAEGGFLFFCVVIVSVF